MREAKQKPENVAASREAAIRQAWLDRTRACDGARTLLEKLQGPDGEGGLLLEHTNNLERAKLRCARLISEVRRIIENGTTRCLMSDPAALAAQFLAGKGLPEIVTEEQNHPMLERFHKSISFTNGSPDIVTDPNDLVIFKEWDRERACVQIIRAAIALQKKAVAETIRASMERFSRTVAEGRAETARQVLALLAELRRVTDSDRALAKGLEQEEIAALNPPPFPMHIVGSDVMSWMLNAARAGMIGTGELTDLQPKTVSPAPEHEVEAEPWLQAQI